MQKMATGMLLESAMELQIVVMPGSNRVDMPLLRGAAQDFGWAIQIARDADELTAVRARGKVGAVLFQQDSLGFGYSYLEMIAMLRELVSDTRLVACNHFSEQEDYPKLCRAGLFGALWMPLRQNEVRQCLGFVWEAEKRLTAQVRRVESQIRRVPLAARAAS
jgi:hypothetical protein